MKKILLGLVLSFLVSTSANASIIDSFDDFQMANTPDVTLSPLGEFVSSADRSFTTSGGSFLGQISAGTFVWVAAGGAFDITYAIGTPSPLTPAVNGSPANLSFLLEGVSWTGGADITLELVLNGVETSSVVVSAGTVGGVVHFLFTDFTTPTLSNITSITLQSEGGSVFSGSLTASSLVVTPEPSSLILGGIGLLVMGGYGYRRRRKTADTNAASV